MPTAPAAAAHGELEVPFRGDVLWLEQQRFAICALGVRQARIASGGVGGRRPAQRQQAKIEQGAKPHVGLEGRGGMTEVSLRGLGVRVCERRGPRVIPRGVILATRGELRQVRTARPREVVAIPGLLGRRAGALRLLCRGRRCAEGVEGEADERRRAPGRGLHDQQRDGEEQRQPRVRPAQLCARFARAGAPVGGHQVAHRSCLIGELGGDERPLSGVRHRPQDVVTPSRPDDPAVLVFLVAQQATPVVPQGDLGRRPAALGDKDEANPGGVEFLGLLDNRGQRVVRLAVGEHDECAVGEIRARPQQLGSLAQGWGERGAPLRRDVGVERVEVEGERGPVTREWRQDVARPGERDQADPVAVQILHQAPRLAQRPAEPAGGGILGEHGARDVDGDHGREPTRRRHDLLLSPARAGERYDAQERRERERGGPEAPGGDRAAHGFFRPQGRAPEAHAPRPRRREPDGAADERREREDDRRVERHQGTRTENVPASTISSASATRPRASGARYASSKRWYTTCSTVLFSSRLISSNTWRSDWVSVARK